MKTDTERLLSLAQAGRYVEMDAAAREVLTRSPDSVLAWKALGIAITMQGGDAVEALERAALLAPDDAEAHSNLGHVHWQQGRFEAAAASCRRALAIRPDFAEAHNNLGNAALGLRRFEQAAESYRQALSHRPAFAAAHGNLGNVLLESGQAEEAVLSYRRAIELDPGRAEVHCRLGNALWELERWEDALASYDDAVALRAEYPEALCNAGEMLMKLWRVEAAVERYRRTLALDPHHANAHARLGGALLQLWQHDAGMQSCRRALELSPKLVIALLNLGNILLDLSRHAEAEQSYRQVLQFEADNVEACIGLGLALRQQGRPQEAAACCHRALRIEPGLTVALALLGELSADRGDFSAAEELLRRASSMDPTLPAPWAGIVWLRKMTDDSEWLEGALRRACRPLAPRDAIHLHYAIGKYFDDLGRVEEAFASYRRANELSKRYRPRYDPVIASRYADRIIASFDRAWLEQVSAAGLHAERPVFVVGMPRSGTTLAEQILGAHSAVTAAGELTFWPLAAAEFGTEVASRGDVASGTDAHRIREMGQDYLRRLAELSADSERVVDKMPGNFFHLGLMHAALPNARIIHVRRNPVATCLSIYRQNFNSAHTYANDLDDLAHYYGQYRRLMAHWRSVLPATSLLEVPYESLVDDPVTWSRQMIAFLGLPWEAGCLEFHRSTGSVLTASRWQVRQTIDGAAVDRWRRYARFIGPLLNLDAEVG